MSCPPVGLQTELDTMIAPANSALDDTITFIIVTCADENLAIMCACLPLIASQLRYMSEKVKSYLRDRPSENSGTNEGAIRLRSCDNQAVSNEQVPEHGSGQFQPSLHTMIRASSERNESIAPSDQIRVKTDLEWRPL